MSSEPDNSSPGKKADKVLEKIPAEPGSLQEAMDEKLDTLKAVKSRMRSARDTRGGRGGPFRALMKGRFGMLIFFAVGALSINWLFKNMFSSGDDTTGSISSDMTFSAGDGKNKGKLRRLPVCQDGIVVITDAAYGVARETAMLLADQGMYVVAAVKTKVELKSFAYEERKGLELIVADPIEPNEVAKLFYRVKQLQNDLAGRKFYGLIVNTADSVLDLDSVASMREQYVRENADLDILMQEQEGSSSRGSRSKKGEKTAAATADPRNYTAFELSQDDIVRAASLVNVPSLDDGYKTILKSSMRVTQAALELWSEADNAFRTQEEDRLRKLHDTYQECLTKPDQGLGGDDQECYVAWQTETERLKRQKSSKAKGGKGKKIANTARESISASDSFGAESCSAGATGRILFMTYNFEGVVGAKVESTVKPPRGLMGFMTGGKAPKRATKTKARRGRSLTNPTQARSMVELNSFYFPLGCGMHCSIKAALDSYIDQLRDAIQGTKASNTGGAGAGNSMMKMIPAPGGQSKFGTYHIAETAIPSKAYRSQKGSRTNKQGKAPFGREAGSLQMPSHFWEVDSQEQSRKMADVDADKQRKKNRYSTTIDTRYSEAANQAAHAIIGAYPKGVYASRLRI